jgi:hypothetical protein
MTPSATGYIAPVGADVAAVAEGADDEHRDFSDPLSNLPPGINSEAQAVDTFTLRRSP